MTMRRRIEETDRDGRNVTVLEEPLDAADHELAGEEEVMEAPADPWRVASGWLRMVASLAAIAFAVIEGLLVFRLGFLLAGANPANGFVDFIYDATGGLVSPFDSVFAKRSVDGGVFEPAALIAIVVYAAIAALVIALLYAASSAPSASGERSVRTRTSRRMRTTRSG